MNNQEQKTGDLDLAKAVREIMVRTGVDPAELANYDSNPQITHSRDKSTALQLMIQKSFWTYQLLLIKNKDTMEDRLLLNQFSDPQAWFTYFANNVVDLINIHKLPQRHGW